MSPRHSGGTDSTSRIDLTTADAIAAKPQQIGLTFNRQSWDAFEAFVNNSDHNEKIMGTFVGEIRVKKDYRQEDYGDGPAGNRYGIRGRYRIQNGGLNRYRFLSLINSIPLG